VQLRSLIAPGHKQGAAMPSSYKPQAYSSVSPYLIVDGASGTIDFLVQVFDADDQPQAPTARFQSLADGLSMIRRDR